ncbi:hypothetical protein HHK36_009777 [Tetracentron sinense]|uniref:Uncharacterized protein n=1 Tax=Tetracentron sinense TaxID=13715 RepID=A0A835DLM8_TETSI|nr:hypothetical protein HHK36_009777 [Tetracentron sinense]
MDPVSVATTTNVFAQVSNIPMLSGTNFKVWKETVGIVLGCMDLDLALWSDQPTATPENPNEVKIEKWDRSNRMCLMIMKRSIPEAFGALLLRDEEFTYYFCKKSGHMKKKYSKYVTWRVKKGLPVEPTAK